jgi:hypothetical protein
LAASFVGLMSWTTLVAFDGYVASARHQGTADHVLGWTLLLAKAVVLPVCAFGIGWLVTAKRARVIAIICFVVAHVVMVILHRFASASTHAVSADVAFAGPIIVACAYAAGGVAIAELAARCRERFEIGLGVRPIGDRAGRTGA